MQGIASASYTSLGLHTHFEAWIFKPVLGPKAGGLLLNQLNTRY